MLPISVTFLRHKQICFISSETHNPYKPLKKDIKHERRTTKIWLYNDNIVLKNVSKSFRKKNVTKYIIKHKLPKSLRSA